MDKGNAIVHYEQALKQLQTILKEMEQGERNMDDLLSQVQQANSLVEQCKNRLRGIENDVRTIL
ncbi:MAG: exodeoxyribonuclease VII small subunit [Aureispira sp.]